MKTKQVSIKKEDGHTYIFRYTIGMECEAVSAMNDIAGLGYCSFDYFDAAQLAYQIGHSMQLGDENEP